MAKFLVFIGIILFLGSFVSKSHYLKPQVLKYAVSAYQEHWALLNYASPFEGQKLLLVKGYETALSEKVLSRKDPVGFCTNVHPKPTLV